MSAIANVNPSATQIGAIAAGSTAGFEEVSKGEALALVRDTIVVLGLQIVFRTMMFLRKLNY